MVYEGETGTLKNKSTLVQNAQCRFKKEKEDKNLRCHSKKEISKYKRISFLLCVCTTPFAIASVHHGELEVKLFNM